MMVHRISGQLETVHPKVDVGGRNSCPLVAIEERVVLDETLEQSRRLGDRILVVTRLGSEHRCLHVSLSTVKAHLSSLMTNLDARNRVELAMWAYETDRV